MSDNDPADLDLNAEAETTGEKPVRKTFRVRRQGKDWEEKEIEPLSKDPAIEAIGKLSIDEVSKILEDPQDPRHEAAKRYNALLSEHLAASFEGIRSLTAGYTKKWASSIAESAKIALPKVEIPELGFGRDSKDDLAARVSSQHLAPPITISRLESLQISPAPTAEQTDELIAVTREQNQFLGDLIARTGEHLSLVKSQLAGAEIESQVNKQQARRNLFAAWIAIAITALVGVIQVVQATERVPLLNPEQLSSSPNADIEHNARVIHRVKAGVFAGQTP